MNIELIKICLKIKFPEIIIEQRSEKSCFIIIDGKYFNLIYFEKLEVESSGVQWVFRFGEMDLDKQFERIKELAAEYISILNQLKEIVYMPKNELKKMAIENIDKWDGEI